MCLRSLFAIILAALSVGLAACGSSPASNTNTANFASVNASNTGISAPSDPQSPVATNKKAEAATENAAPTLGPVVQAYYDALKRKDDAALQNVLAAATIKKTQADMKSEKRTGMAAYLAEYDLTDKPVEVRNEQISGEKGLAEIRGGAYLKWTPFLFVNEGGKWKYTGITPDLQAVSPQSNAKPAK